MEHAELRRLCEAALADNDAHAIVTDASEPMHAFLRGCGTPAAVLALLDEIDRLRAAIRDAGFAVTQTSGKWSIHDVSEKAKAEREYDEKRTAEVIMRSIELEADRDRLAAENARLRSALEAIAATEGSMDKIVLLGILEWVRSTARGALEGKS